jgi:hypothetical protein
MAAEGLPLLTVLGQRRIIAAVSIDYLAARFWQGENSLISIQLCKAVGKIQILPRNGLMYLYYILCIIAFLGLSLI